MENTFTITRIYADAEGESHFEDQNILLHNQGPIGFLATPEKAKEIIFRKVAATYDYDYHTAPARQYIVLLDGVIEIEVSSGKKRQFEQGSVLLVEDTEGKGHKTRNITPDIRSSIFITL